MTAMLASRTDDGNGPWLLDRMRAASGLSIPRAPKAVLKELVRHSNRAGTCWPLIRTMAENTSYSERQVGRALIWLTDEGYVSRTRRRRANGFYSGWKYKVRVVPMKLVKSVDSEADPSDIVADQHSAVNSEEVNETPDGTIGVTAAEPITPVAVRLEPVPPDEPPVDWNVALPSTESVTEWDAREARFAAAADELESEDADYCAAVDRHFDAVCVVEHAWREVSRSEAIPRGSDHRSRDLVKMAEGAISRRGFDTVDRLVGRPICGGARTAYGLLHSRLRDLDEAEVA